MQITRESFDKLCELGIIKYISLRFQVLKNGAPIQTLEKSKVKAFDKLNELLAEGNLELEKLISTQLYLDTTTPKQELEPEKFEDESQPPSQDPQTKVFTIEEEKRQMFAEALSKVVDIEPVVGGADLDIYIDGVDSRLSDNPTVRAFPLELRWRNKMTNVDNGDGLTVNKGWTLLRKSDFTLSNGKRIITTQRDDSPNKPFWQVENLVLCGTRKDKYIERKKIMVAKNTANPYIQKKQRNEFTAIQAKNPDVEQSNQSYLSSAMQGRAIESQNLQKNFNMSAAEASKMLENVASGDEALAIAKQIADSL